MKINILGKGKLVVSAFLLLTSVTVFGAELSEGVDGSVGQADEMSEDSSLEPPAQKPTIVELMESENQMLLEMEEISKEKEEQRLLELEEERLAKVEEERIAKEKAKAEEEAKAQAVAKEKANAEAIAKAERDKKAKEEQQAQQRAKPEPQPKTETQSTNSSKGRLLGTFEATAYTDNVQSQGKWVGQTATGRTPQVGVIAVDPSVIPLNTKLYVEGYGNCIAGDTGGAIKGKRLDLFHNTQGECKSFGRRNVQVWIVD